MPKRRVQLEVWVRYNSSTGYIWPQVYPTKEVAALDEEYNYPVKIMKLVSEPYFNETHNYSNSFGTEVLVNKEKKVQ